MPVFSQFQRGMQHASWRGMFDLLIVGATFGATLALAFALQRATLKLWFWLIGARD